MSAPPSAVQVSLTAATLTGNHGGEAMLLAAIGRLRERVPHAAFNVFSYYPRADREGVDDASVRVFSLTPLALVLRLVPLAVLLAGARRLGLGSAFPLFPADVRALAGSRVLVDLAGVSFVAGRERFLPYNVLTLVPAFLLGVPVVKAAQAIGPFPVGSNRLAAEPVLGRCAAVFARGERSFGFVRELLGPRPAVRRADDMAFLLESRDALARHETPGLAPLLRRIAERRGSARSVVEVCPSSLLGADFPRIWSGLAMETAMLLGGAVVLAALAYDTDTLLPAVGVAVPDAWIAPARAGALVLVGVVVAAAAKRVPHRGALARAVVLTLSAWALLGLSFHAMVVGIAGSGALAGAAAGAVGLVPTAGLFAFAWTLGFVAFFSPAGIGVREVLLGLGLASLGPPALVAAIVVGHRLVYLAADVLCAGAALALFRPGPR